MTTSKLLLLPVVSSIVACQFQARSPEDYRKDTRALLETRTSEVRECYADSIRLNPNAAGSVVVRFAISPKTGAITSAQVLPQSTAPAPIPECVRIALQGLALQPPDAREGDATFVWTFTPS